MIWLLLLTGGVFVLYRSMMFARTRAAAPKRALLPEGEVWSWGRGVWGLVLGSEVDRGLEAEVSEALLAVTWRVTDVAGLDEAERSMRERFPELAVWRTARMMALVRLAVAGRVIDPSAGSERLREHAAAIRDRVGSWEELGATFAAEHETFLAGPASDEGAGLARLPDGAQLARTRAWLAEDVWPQIAWE